MSNDMDYDNIANTLVMVRLISMALVEIERQIALGPDHHDIFAIDQILRGEWSDDDQPG